MRYVDIDHLEENSRAAIFEPTLPRPNGSGSGGRWVGVGAGACGLEGRVGAGLGGLFELLAAGTLGGDGLDFGLGCREDPATGGFEGAGLRWA